MVARPTLGIPDAEGKKHWREFDIERTFANEAEARSYASENKIRVLED